jgi:hypothetical protein
MDVQAVQDWIFQAAVVRLSAGTAVCRGGRVLHVPRNVQCAERNGWGVFPVDTQLETNVL